MAISTNQQTRRKKRKERTCIGKINLARFGDWRSFHCSLNRTLQRVRAQSEGFDQPFAFPRDGFLFSVGQVVSKERRNCSVRRKFSKFVGPALLPSRATVPAHSFIHQHPGTLAVHGAFITLLARRRSDSIIICIRYRSKLAAGFFSLPAVLSFFFGAGLVA